MPRKPSRSAPRKRPTTELATAPLIESDKLILQVHIELQEIKPIIWRRLLPADASFFDLHVALNAAMGWEDSHLHEFEVPRKDSRTPRRFDHPDPSGRGFGDFDDVTPDWQTPVMAHLSLVVRCIYVYDFGDG